MPGSGTEGCSTWCHPRSKRHRGLLGETGCRSGRTCCSGSPCQTSAYLAPKDASLLLCIFISPHLYSCSSGAAVLTGAQAETDYPVGEASVELCPWELPVLL